MRPKAAAALLIAIAALTVGALAQSRPSFTGNWTVVVDPAAQAAATRTNPGWTDGYRWYPGTITEPAALMPMSIAQDEKTLTVTTKNPPTKIIYNLDGTAAKNRVTLGGKTSELNSIVHWDSGRLLITTTVTRDGQTSLSTQIWSLDAADNLSIESRSGGRDAPPTTTKATYKKTARPRGLATGASGAPLD